MMYTHGTDVGEGGLVYTSHAVSSSIYQIVWRDTEEIKEIKVFEIYKMYLDILCNDGEMQLQVF